MKISATAIAVFLDSLDVGSFDVGKTTLVRHRLESAGSRWIALMVNEFEYFGVDADAVIAGRFDADEAA
jgi:hypothetical protein